MPSSKWLSLYVLKHITNTVSKMSITAISLNGDVVIAADVDIINVDVLVSSHDGVIKWKRFSRYWPFVRGIRLTTASDAELWRIFFYLRLNKREAADLKRHRIHYDVTVMHCQGPFSISDKGSYLKILWSLEVARMVISIVLSIWFLTSASAALLSKHQNYRGIGQYRQ